MFFKALFSCILILSTAVESLSPASTSRREMMLKTAAIVSGSSGSFAFSQAAPAYPRRDVGDPATRSAATAAMNDQAYKTNNRLEQQVRRYFESFVISF